MTPTKARRVLRWYWLGFGGLVLLSLFCDRWPFQGHPPYRHHSLTYYVWMLGQVLLYAGLAANTYWSRRRIWWLAIAVASLKLLTLWQFILTEPFTQYSTSFYPQHVNGLFWLKLRFLGFLFTGGNLPSMALYTGIYIHWLYLCEVMLQPAASQRNDYDIRNLSEK